MKLLNEVDSKAHELVYADGVEAWKQYARAIIDMNNMNPGKIVLTMQTLEAFHEGKSMDDVLT